MFGSVVLDAILGMLALFTLLGICVTTLTEIIQSFFQKVRAAYLHDALRLLFCGKLKALNDRDMDFFQQVLDHPVIKAMAAPGKRPSYLDSGMLAQVVIDLLLRKDDAATVDIPLEQINEVLTQGIAQIPSEHLHRALSTILAVAQAKVITTQELLCSFKTKLEQWINAVMDRAEGWTRRNAKVVSLACSLALCLLLNVNAFDLMKGLVQDDALRAASVKTVTGVVQEDLPAKFEKACVADVDPSKCQFSKALGMLQVMPQVAIGWNTLPAFLQDEQKNRTIWFGYWLFGVLTAALAASLGGDFWFRILGRAIRLTGKTTQEPKS